MEVSDFEDPGHSMPAEFDALIDGVRSGSDDAARQLLDQYGPHIIRVIRRRMNPKLRERFDSQDFTQAVWASFFGNLDNVGRFSKSTELVQFLSRVARNKVIDAGRRTQVRSETHMDDLSAEIQSERDCRLNVAEPTPSQHAMAHERWDHLVQNETESDRELLQMRRQGLTQSEIAEKLNISERQVRRILSRLSRKTDPEESQD